MATHKNKKASYEALPSLDWNITTMIEPVPDPHTSALSDSEARSIDTASGKEAPAELSSSRVKKIFTDIAWDYERFNALSSFGQYISWLKSSSTQAPLSQIHACLILLEVRAM